MTKLTFHPRSPSPPTTSATPASKRQRINPTLSTLPFELFVAIAQFLDYNSLVNLSRVSRALQDPSESIIYSSLPLMDLAGRISSSSRSSAHLLDLAFDKWEQLIGPDGSADVLYGAMELLRSSFNSRPQRLMWVREVKVHCWQESPVKIMPSYTKETFDNFPKLYKVERMSIALESDWEAYLIGWLNIAPGIKSLIIYAGEIPPEESDDEEEKTHEKDEKPWPVLEELEELTVLSMLTTLEGFISWVIRTSPKLRMLKIRAFGYKQTGHPREKLYADWKVTVESELVKTLKEREKEKGKGKIVLDIPDKLVDVLEGRKPTFKRTQHYWERDDY
ncbi:hypothetical protein TREMEDRAFT_63513 [Tremella mesenterica DSM 1558]|uniref:uncharacterized protein n=1 Tax=Tremella mesenterica (strain ATCC 24925 / CBS 8224 / DSM 1558 / NBRC 9311 / NRRL Y-6157 / RJB 2259-6 / UBC 559-6) TaxID=578456 RepID=UPI0003F4A14D|nr:uncharacterized protein TREMEDRAFT_63513 [Tremella mesenterica DSM 1558]EIW68343.1 hypothetical protein TREMEDRAFT_63513 [Tremella mesenterica DSM 1558]